MKLSLAILTAAIASTHAFVPQLHSTRAFSTTRVALLTSDEELEKAIDRQLEYKPGAADGELAQRFGHLAGKEIKTVGEAYAEFNTLMEQPLNALYRNTITDVVGNTHLITVNARFQRDGIWSLGLISAIELLLRNYPERDQAAKCISSLITSVGLDEAEIRAEAKVISEWAAGKKEADVTAALKGEGDGPIAAIAKSAKGDDYWMYSRYFGLGLIAVMEMAGVEPTKDASYKLMEQWMGPDCLGKTVFTATEDSDTWFKVREKLEMMETLMKEIEIREKKRMAERLEDRAESALRKAELEAQWEEEVKNANAATMKMEAEKEKETKSE
jgi:hypothetical protein